MTQIISGIPRITIESLRSQAHSLAFGGQVVNKLKVLLDSETIRTFSGGDREQTFVTAVLTRPIRPFFKQDGLSTVDLLIVEKSKTLLGGVIEAKELQDEKIISHWGVKDCDDDDLQFLHLMGFTPAVSVVRGYDDSPRVTLENQSIDQWIVNIEKAVKEELSQTKNKDGSHDFGHLDRVSSLAGRFAREEKKDELVASAAGLLHDIVNLPKNDPNATKSSLFAAVRSEEILLDLEFPKNLIPNTCHSVHAHSFSAKVEPKTGEAKCVQDADRMEALGSFGLMRTFYCSGMFGSKLMDENDPAGEKRKLNDKEFALDHFVLKLLTLHDLMKTGAGRKTALLLSNFLKDYRDGLILDQKTGNFSSGRLKFASVFHEAGQKELALFNPEDPFAENGRELDPAKYPLDQLLKEDYPFIRKFLEQLRFELNGYLV